jgi:hypothetical protein
MFCNPIDGQSKKGTSNFKLREYNLVPDQNARGMKIEFPVMQANSYRLHQRCSTSCNNSRHSFRSQHNPYKSTKITPHNKKQNSNLFHFVCFRTSFQETRRKRN